MEDKKTNIQAVISTDWHIKRGNEETIIDLVKQKIRLAKEINVKALFCLGDVFESRQAQPLSSLKCFETILDLVRSMGMQLHCLAGNHDKTNYNSKDSFLDQFQWHPALMLTKAFSSLYSSNDTVNWFIPFFSEDIWIDILKNKVLPVVKEQTKYKHILFSHQAVYGSTNNDGSKVKNSIKPSMLKDFYKVFLGHYHNQQQVADNIFHLPSIQANNFGEDNEKGFTLLHSDGSHEFVKSEFKEYVTLELDLDTLSKREVNKYKKEAEKLLKEESVNLRYKVIGSEDKVTALKIDGFKALGIDVKKEHKSIEASTKAAQSGQKVTEHTNKTIMEAFDVFCEEEGYEDVEYGKNCLKIKLQKNG